MAREGKQTGLASSCSTSPLTAVNWAHESSLYFQHRTNSKERAGNGTKMATCQSHYMKNRRGEKHTMTSGNSKHSPPEHTGRIWERSLLRTKTASWTSDGNQDMPLRPLQQGPWRNLSLQWAQSSFSRENAWLPQHTQDNPSPCALSLYTNPEGSF